MENKINSSSHLGRLALHKELGFCCCFGVGEACCVVCRTFVVPPGTELRLQQWKQSPHHWTTRELLSSPSTTPWVSSQLPSQSHSFSPVIKLRVCSMVRNPSASAGDSGDTDWTPGSRRSPGVGNGSTLQYSCLENSMDRGAWWGTVHGAAKNQTRLSNWTCTETQSQWDRTNRRVLPDEMWKIHVTWICTSFEI